MTLAKDLYMCFMAMFWTFVDGLIDCYDRFNIFMNKKYVKLFDGYYFKVVIYNFEKDRASLMYDYSYSLPTYVLSYIYSLFDSSLSWLVTKAHDELIVSYNFSPKTQHPDTVMIGLFLDDNGIERVHFIPLFQTGDLSSNMVNLDELKDNKLEVVYCEVDEKFDISHVVKSMGWMLNHNNAWSCEQIIKMFTAIYSHCPHLKKARYSDEMNMSLAVIQDDDYVEYSFKKSEILNIPRGKEDVQKTEWDNSF